MSDKRFYHLPIPRLRTVFSWIGKVLGRLITSIGVIVFAPTVLLAWVANGFLKGKPGAVNAVQSAVVALLLLLVIPFNLVILMLGMQYAVSPHVIVTAVEEDDYRYTMEITERKSDFVKGMHTAFANLIGAPDLANDVRRTFIYDARTDTWWALRGIHAVRIETKDSWFWETHKWSHGRLMGYMEDYQKDEEGLRNEYLKKVREEIEQPLREKQAEEREKWEAQLEPPTEPESDPEAPQDEESDF